MLPHPIDIPAILLGIFLALRRSEVRAEEIERHPGVVPADFERWQARALRIYSFGVRLCFGKVAFDFAFKLFLERFPLEMWLARTLGISFDVLWIALLVFNWVRQHRVRKLGTSLGINLNAPPANAERGA